MNSYDSLPELFDYKELCNLAKKNERVLEFIEYIEPAVDSAGKLNIFPKDCYYKDFTETDPYLIHCKVYNDLIKNFRFPKRQNFKRLTQPIQNEIVYVSMICKIYNFPLDMIDEIIKFY